MDQLSMKAARVAAGLNQEECAKAMGITREWYSKLESGVADVQTYMRYAFSHAVGISVEHIIFPTKSSKSEPQKQEA